MATMVQKLSSTFPKPSADLTPSLSIDAQRQTRNFSVAPDLCPKSTTWAWVSVSQPSDISETPLQFWQVCDLHTLALISYIWVTLVLIYYTKKKKNTIAINVKSAVVTLNRKYYVNTAKLFNSRCITWLALFLRPFHSSFRKNGVNVGKILGVTPSWESIQKDRKRIFKSITFSQSHTISSRLPRHLRNTETDSLIPWELQSQPKSWEGRVENKKDSLPKMD